MPTSRLRSPVSTLWRSLLLCALVAPSAQAQPRVLEGAFTLRNASKCLEVNEPQVRTNGARVQMDACDGRPGQQWRMERNRLVNLLTNRCLDLHAPDAGSNGARIQLVDCHGGNNQHWRFERSQWLVQVDGRCLDVHGADFNRDGARVQSWDCHGGPNQQWVAEALVAMAPPAPPALPAPPVPVLRDLEAGPLFNQAEAERRCPAVCSPGRWNGQWRTTVPGRMSVCACQSMAVLPAPQMSPGGPPAPIAPQALRPMPDERFDELMRAIAQEGFGSAKLGVVEVATRSNYFVVLQLRRIVEALSFAQEKLTAVDLVAPRLLDRQNAASLYGAFDFDSDRAKVRAVFDKLK